MDFDFLGKETQRTTQRTQEEKTQEERTTQRTTQEERTTQRTTQEEEHFLDLEEQKNETLIPIEIPIPTENFLNLTSPIVQCNTLSFYNMLHICNDPRTLQIFLSFQISCSTICAIDSQNKGIWGYTFIGFPVEHEDKMYFAFSVDALFEMGKVILKNFLFDHVDDLEIFLDQIECIENEELFFNAMQILESKVCVNFNKLSKIKIFSFDSVFLPIFKNCMDSHVHQILPHIEQLEERINSLMFQVQLNNESTDNMNNVSNALISHYELKKAFLFDHKIWKETFNKQISPHTLNCSEFCYFQQKLSNTKQNIVFHMYNGQTFLGNIIHDPIPEYNYRLNMIANLLPLAIRKIRHVLEMGCQTIEQDLIRKSFIAYRKFIENELLQCDIEEFFVLLPPFVKELLVFDQNFPESIVAIAYFV
jgi:hypothetical protein